VIEVLKTNASYRVELDEDVTREHLPHKSWGIYRVIRAANSETVYEGPNRDKAFGVYEYLSREAHLRP
jgi:hypothetical protein